MEVLKMKSIRYIGLLTIILFAGIEVLAQQQVPSDSDSKFFRVPSDFAFTLVSSQDDSPILLERTELYTNKNANRVICNIQVRNISEKAIRNIRLKIITNFLFHPIGGGRLEIYDDGLDLRDTDKQQVLLPNTSVWTRNTSAFSKDLLPNEIILRIRNQDSQIKAKFIVAIVVNSVEFTDGTIYDVASNASDLDKLFFDGIDVR